MNEQLTVFSTEEDDKINIKLSPLGCIDGAVKEFKLDAIFAMFSGGHDSLCSTFMASQHTLFRGVIHINTGIGIPETQKYVETFCSDRGLPLHVFNAMDVTDRDGNKTPQDYDFFVRKWGFPGPSWHRIMYNRLKERPLNNALRELKKTYRRIGLVTGIRLHESRRRKNNYSLAKENGYEKHGSKVWINPIIHFNDEDKATFIEENNLPRNPVYQYMCKSGECLCGAFAEKGELLILEKHYPEIYDRLNRLHEETKTRFPWHWDEAPSSATIDYARKERNGQSVLDVGTQMLCTDCIYRFEKNI